MVAALAGVSGCGDRAVDAALFGKRVFADPGLSTGPFNRTSCATCHTVQEGAGAVVSGRHDPGFNLANTVGRASWWGGEATRLLDAVNICLEQFMGGRKLAPEDEAARQLYAYLDEHSPDVGLPAAPLTIVRVVTGLRELVGDAGRGRRVWEGACSRCHGAAHTGRGRIALNVSIVPEETQRAFPDEAREVVVEKIRHGRFLGIGGFMPFYAREVLSDEQIADLLAYLGL